MNNIEGWIKLHRKLINWEWYDNVNVRITFIHCLLVANYEDYYNLVNLSFNKQ